MRVQAFRSFNAPWHMLRSVQVHGCITTANKESRNEPRSIQGMAGAWEHNGAILSHCMSICGDVKKGPLLDPGFGLVPSLDVQKGLASIRKSGGCCKKEGKGKPKPCAGSKRHPHLVRGRPGPAPCQLTTDRAECLVCSIGMKPKSFPNPLEGS